MTYQFTQPSRLKLLYLLLLLLPCFQTNGQGYVSPFKEENGKIKMKTRDEIRADEARLSANKSKTSYPTSFDKPKAAPKENGEIWIDGFCRFRPPAYNRSRYNEDVSEVEYCREKYPYDTIIATDDFSGNGSIPWAENAWFGKAGDIRQLAERIKLTLGDGISFPMYDSLQKMSAYSVATTSGYKKGRDYEFSRAVSIWIKRKTGSEKSYIKLSTRYPFSNGQDYTDFEVNDRGQFKISRFCDNCRSPQYKEVESGKSKSWNEGEWNELTVKKDDFNTVTVLINGEEVCRYQLFSLPITVRFATFYLQMPYKWEKEKLMYNIGRVTSVSYPKIK